MMDSVAQRLEALLNKLDTVEEAILNEHYLQHQSCVLEKLGGTLGLSRECIHQRQTELDRKIESCIDVVARNSAIQLAKNLELIDSCTNVELHVQRVVPHADETVQRVLTHLMVRLAGYTYKCT